MLLPAPVVSVKFFSPLATRPLLWMITVSTADEVSLTEVSMVTPVTPPNVTGTKAVPPEVPEMVLNPLDGLATEILLSLAGVVKVNDARPETAREARPLNWIVLPPAPPTWTWPAPATPSVGVYV